MTELELLRDALEQSLVLQSHYASLLNMYDGGTRLEFRSVDAWLRRVAEFKVSAHAREEFAKSIRPGSLPMKGNVQ